MKWTQPIQTYHLFQERLSFDYFIIITWSGTVNHQDSNLQHCSQSQSHSHHTSLHSITSLLLSGSKVKPVVGKEEKTNWWFEELYKQKNWKKKRKWGKWRAKKAFAGYDFFDRRTIYIQEQCLDLEVDIIIDWCYEMKILENLLWDSFQGGRQSGLIESWIFFFF